MPKCVKCGAKTSGFLSDYCKECEVASKENRASTFLEDEPVMPSKEGKYSAWTIMAWILFVITALAAVWVVSNYGSYSVPSTYGFRTIYNTPIILGAIAQSVFMLMVAGLFTMMNQIRNMVAVVGERDALSPPEKLP